MKGIKYIGALCLATVCLSAAKAQNLNSAYYLEGYNYRSQMNPAFGAEHSYFSVPGVGNLNVSMQGNIGLKNVLYPSADGMNTFMSSSVSAQEFLGGLHSKNKIVSNIKTNILSAGFKGFGGFNTIALNVRANVGANIPYEMFELMKQTTNKVYNINDFAVHTDAFAELALGHSHQIGKNLRIGANLKFLLGGANIDAKLNDFRVELGEEEWKIVGHAQVDASVKGLKYETETSEYKSGRSYERVKKAEVKNTGLNGFGMAIDLGATYDLSDVVEGLSVNAAVLDLGFINWNNDMRAANEGDEFVFKGFSDVAVDDKGSANSVGNQWDGVSDQLKEFAHLADKGDQGSRSRMIAATINVGANYVLPAYKKISFGALSSTCVNRAYSWTEGRVSANWQPVKCIELSTSYALGTFGSSLGAVFNLHGKGWNLTLGTNHVIGEMSKECIPLNSRGSVTLGMSVPL